MLVNLVGAAHLFNPAMVHHHHPVGHFESLLLIMGDKHAGQVDLVMQITQPAPQVLAHLGVQRAKWFVKQQYPGFDRQRASQCDTLALPPGQLCRVSIRQPGQLHQLQQRHHLVVNRLFRGALRTRPHRQAECHVIENRHVAKQGIVLKHKADLPF